MKKEWSPDWKGSKQPRKQRKYFYNAPLHVRRKFVGSRLTAEATRQFGRRSLPVCKGDEVRVMRGNSKGLKGTVERVDLKKVKIYIDGISVKKVDGSEVMKPMRPSNLMITKAKMDDKRRQMMLERTEERAKELRSKPARTRTAPKPAKTDKGAKASGEEKEGKGAAGSAKGMEEPRSTKEVKENNK